LAKQLLALNPDRILLDNFKPAEVREVVQEKERLGCKTPLEASGGVTLERAKAMAAAGADFISVGAITHSPKAIDFALDWKK
jgi:nicotinate-nucleotide pyrophosphorylase (carboxylating)